MNTYLFSILPAPPWPLRGSSQCWEWRSPSFASCCWSSPSSLQPVPRETWVLSSLCWYWSSYSCADTKCIHYLWLHQKDGGKSSSKAYYTCGRGSSTETSGWSGPPHPFTYYMLALKVAWEPGTWPHSSLTYTLVSWTVEEETHW